jgi:hypothetical protein
VYNATLLIQTADTVPQFFEVPVAFVTGASGGVTVTGAFNGACFQPVAVGFGDANRRQPSTAAKSGFRDRKRDPRAFLLRVSHSVEHPDSVGGRFRPGSIGRRRQVASFFFNLAASGPGIFTDIAHQNALVPFSSG